MSTFLSIVGVAPMSVNISSREGEKLNVYPGDVYKFMSEGQLFLRSIKSKIKKYLA